MAGTSGVGRAGLLERSEHLKVLGEVLTATVSSGQGRIVLEIGRAHV